MATTTTTAPPDISAAMMGGQNALRHQVVSDESSRLGHAVTIPDVVWDVDIAKTAQAYAQTLVALGTLKHSATALGENLYTDTGHGVSGAVDRAISSWASEKADFRYDTNTCTAGQDCGHYTQLVWAASRRIGCGLATGAAGRIFVVCNYSPTGNLAGQRPY